METNIFSAYLKLVQLPDDVKRRNKIKVNGKIPRFDLIQSSGYYRPIERLKNGKGQVYFYLQNTRGIIKSPDGRRADRFLQGKESLNISSIYYYSFQGNSSYLIGYGNPNREKTYGKQKKPNPFLEVKNDGYLFLISQDWQTIEILVVSNGYNTILGNAKALADGVYHEALENMRAAARPIYNY